MSRSASLRELANTIEERCASTRSTMASSTCGQIEPGWSDSPGSVMSGTGTRTVRSKVFGAGGETIVIGAAPTRNRPTSSAGRTVAESPIRCTGRSVSMSSRASDRARCAPRLEPAMACTSSTMTVRTVRSVSRAAEVSMRNSDSGVVIRMSGGVRCILRRAAAGVSPERTPTVISGGSSPSRLAVWVMPTSGARRLRSTSTASALSGEM
ncbi:Uncharacterised protein [Mycobacteroides abscessus subsp. abscessus]|nr:Uncharacterised protein [Mycobacteroides abscessus subsp. abscessus]